MLELVLVFSQPGHVCSPHFLQCLKLQTIYLSVLTSLGWCTILGVAPHNASTTVWHLKISLMTSLILCLNLMHKVGWSVRLKLNVMLCCFDCWRCTRYFHSSIFSIVSSYTLYCQGFIQSLAIAYVLHHSCPPIYNIYSSPSSPSS